PRGGVAVAQAPDLPRRHHLRGVPRARQGGIEVEGGPGSGDGRVQGLQPTRRRGLLLPPSGDGMEARPRAAARAAVRRRHLVVVSGIHDVAVEGFTKGTDAYERARPSYPPAVVSFVVRELGIGPASTVVDLAAGTGKIGRASCRERG